MSPLSSLEICILVHVSLQILCSETRHRPLSSLSHVLFRDTAVVSSLHDPTEALRWEHQGDTSRTWVSAAQSPVPCPPRDVPGAELGWGVLRGWARRPQGSSRCCCGRATPPAYSAGSTSMFCAGGPVAPRRGNMLHVYVGGLQVKVRGSSQRDPPRLEVCRCG